MNDPEKWDNPRDILAAAIAGDLDGELAAENEVHPDDYDREEWVESQEEVPEDFDPETVSGDTQTAESDD